MGCSGYKAIDTKLFQEVEPDMKVKLWKFAKIDIKNSITELMMKRKINSMEIGIYEKISYHKNNKRNDVFKNSIRKVFINKKDEKEKNIQIMVNTINKYFEINHQYEKYNDSDNDEYFSVTNVINNNYSDIVNYLSSSQTISKQKGIILIFIDDLPNDTLTSIHNKYPNNVFLITLTSIDKSLSVKYKTYIGNSFVLSPSNELLFWYDNTMLSEDMISSLLSFAEKKNSLNQKITKEYIKELLKKSDISYNITYQCYTLYNSSQLQSKCVVFPLVVSSSNQSISVNKDIALIASPIQKINIEEYIITSIKSKLSQKDIDINIETFKEKRLSLILKRISTYKKQFIIKISSPISYKDIHNVISYIQNELNPKLKVIDMNYEIRHFVILPKESSSIEEINTDKKFKHYVIVRDSKCIQYVLSSVIEKYKEAYDNDIGIIIYSSSKSDNIQTEEIISYLDIDNKNNDTLCNCFFYNFSPETYNSHIILSLNDNQQITESDFIKNSAVMSIKSKPPLITKGDFSSIKKTFTSEADSIISSIQSLSSNNKISNDKIFSTLGAQDRIYYQPFLSLKYNKVSASYKNYTVNYVNFTDNNNTIDDSSFISKFNKINPLCKIFSVNDSYYHIDNTYIKCRNCNKKLYGKISNERGIILTDQYSFYICPITKNIFCVDCEPNIRNDYPFNLIYIQCSDRNIMMNISMNNIDYFKNVSDSKDYPEVVDNTCDICHAHLINQRPSMFYLFCNVINRNIPCLMCENCFGIIKDRKQRWRLTKRFEYIERFIIKNYIDLDNIIIKRIIVK